MLRISPLLSNEQRPLDDIQANNDPFDAAPELGRVASHFVSIDSGAIDIKPRLSQSEVARRMEVDRSVKSAPWFETQRRDLSRTNHIMYLGGQFDVRGAQTAAPEFTSERRVISEHEGLMQLYDFLSAVATSEYLPLVMMNTANAILKDLTFIGEKEYQEAAQGIATYWKSALNSNPQLQIFAVTGEIAKSNDNYIDDQGRAQVKSDDYLLEAVLAHFTDDELELYAGRLTRDGADIVETQSENLKVVLLDDWTISGSQLMEARDAFMRRCPGLAASVEVQLLVADERRLRQGIGGNGVGNPATTVRAYYIAHQSVVDGEKETYMTGSHSSVDYGFEYAIRPMVIASQRRYGPTSEPRVTMPPLTNIVRPYRSGDNSPRPAQVDRLKVAVKANE